ncbi:hypothetical protein [Spiroplasma endosymbiont of Polydrusus pterygomalis]|uniref:hypothetical protein n=1 Tax=Spiroplasma endosymbiont of Polydrusus pterygomalis TaxID=3139327 RepID=UPI003CCAB795
MDKETKEREKKILQETKQQSRKLDLLLAKAERQAEKLKNLQDSHKPLSKPKPSKSPKM